jgi:hypothetical protein
MGDILFINWICRLIGAFILYQEEFHVVVYWCPRPPP